MNQVDYPQPTSFNPALAFPAQAQIHSSGGQSFFPRSSVGQQPFTQAPYPGTGPHKQQQQLQNGGAAFNNLNFNVNGSLPSTYNVSQQQLAGQQLPFTTATYSQSISAPSAIAGGLPGNLPHSASPFHGASPHAAPFGQLSPLGQSQPQQNSMAAPPNPMHASPQTPVRPQSRPLSPKSPASLAQEKERIAVLLEINNDLLLEMQRLQALGKGGAPTLEHAALMQKQGLNVQMGSEEFIQVMLRVHANLGYLCGTSDHALRPGAKQAPHPPNYVQAPPAMPQLAEKYSRLRLLFPNWAGIDNQAASRRASGMNFGSSVSPGGGNPNQ